MAPDPRKLVAALAVAGLCGCGLSAERDVPSARAPDSAQGDRTRAVVRVRTVAEPGGRVDWSPANDLIAYGNFKEPEHTDIYLMSPDGTEKRCLSCDAPGLPQISNDNPAWHPGGELVLFQSIDPDLKLPPTRQAQERYLTQGGVGFHNNLWVISKDGKRVQQLTRLRAGEASLHAHFSYDGSKLLWTAFALDEEAIRRPGRARREGRRFGRWVMKVADFISDGAGARLANERQYHPQGTDETFYETHGFSPDGRKIIFSASIGRKNTLDIDIWTMDLATGRVQQLTDTPGEWDEHAHFTPSGRKVVWMSSRGYKITLPETVGTGRLWAKELRTEYWSMNPDGSGRTRLTFFNEKGEDESAGVPIIASDNSWNRDGTKLVALVAGAATSRSARASWSSSSASRCSASLSPVTCHLSPPRLSDPIAPL